MAKVDKLTFDYTEIVTALLKKENIHEGIWMLYLEFGLAAVNAPVNPEAGAEPLTEEEQLNNLMPTAIIPIKKIGIQRGDRMSNLAVDAAIANPKPVAGKKVRK
jgi:hypothetical protein